MFTIEDVRESYQDYLGENHLSPEEYPFTNYVDDNYKGEYIIGLQTTLASHRGRHSIPGVNRKGHPGYCH